MPDIARYVFGLLGLGFMLGLVYLDKTNTNNPIGTVAYVPFVIFVLGMFVGPEGLGEVLEKLVQARKKK